jgi:N-acetyl-anhydromuramyl-L-alanine amidase AmpD
VLVEPGTQDLEALGRVVRQFVVHYDVCGLSRTCFKVLHDRRGLSVHFMLDIDGTLYQTMDLRDQAWHAAHANPYSIGIEIANMGARPARERAELDEWYVRDAQGMRIRIPAWAGDGGVRTPAFVGRPARPDIVRGQVHGEDLWMYDLTPEQYDSLVELTATLCRLFPQIDPDAPRDRARRVRTDALSGSEQARFGGVIGHHHLTERKRDPGPAFDWDGFLEAVRFRLRLQGVP